ncbi:hypothetical protein MKW94_020741 [Papaver nudicaule]|uniref:RING-type E3 ubiquitin transferase n=1 Tax=Papaver nudicaule TaxID=74823 RepID=A0AA42B502_PAPNU|nr:hypothetical protein [Papaver nudicaule]
MDSSKYFWCYMCSGFVKESGVCPECGFGFVEEIETPTPSTQAEYPRIRFLSDIIMAKLKNSYPRSLNLVIVIRGDDGVSDDYELYYDSGSGLKPCSASMHDLFMESGYNEIFTTIVSQTESNISRCNHQRAAKAVAESLPLIEISECHVSNEPHCAVCSDVFELGSEAREMPCKHMYHTDCILPWLSIRNSCPVCRHALPTDLDGGTNIPGAPRIILCESRIDSRSAITKVIQNVVSLFRGDDSSSSNSETHDRYWELIDIGGLHWHRLC